jgi:hypothetical protein
VEGLRQAVVQTQQIVQLEAVTDQMIAALGLERAMEVMTH